VLSPLELAVLEAVARRLGADAPAWRVQCQAARVIARSHSGVGFVTRIDMPVETPALPPATARRITAVRASHPGLDEPAEFLLQLKGGRLLAIEAFCGSGLWPADERHFAIVPAGGG